MTQTLNPKVKYQPFEGKFIVAAFFAYGWDTPAHTEDDNDNTIPLVFNTIEEAKADMEEYIRDVNEAIARGDMGSASRVKHEDLKVYMADMDENGNVTVYEVNDKANVLRTFNVENNY